MTREGTPARSDVLLVALTVVLGLQTLRAFLPLVGTGRVSDGAPARGPVPGTTAWAPGMLLFAVGAFLYYVTYDGEGDGFTYPSWRPHKRIDYIWISPDLSARDFRLLPGQASDHLGLAVTVGK